MATADAQIAAEVALGALFMATAFGFCRLFTGWSWFPTLALAAIGSDVIAAACRRKNLSVALSALVSVVVGAVFVSLVFYRSQSAYGLPTRATWHAATSDLAAAWHSFGSSVALVEPQTGFVLAAALALWIAAFLSDGFAFRAGAAPETLVPPGLIFVFCSALAADRFRLLSAALWLGTAIVFYALHRTLQQEGSGGWLTSHRKGTVAAAARVGAVLGVGAIAAGLLVGPLLPGANNKPIIDTRNPSHSTRQTVSPLVDIQGRLTQSSDVEVFSVKSAQPAYWRLTALDDFDGRLWTSNRTYHDASGHLSGALSPQYSSRLAQQFTIQSLDSIWLPAAYSPANLSIDEDVRYDPDTSSLVTRAGQLAAGTTYSVVSAVPNLTPGELKQDSRQANANFLAHYTALPGDWPAALTTIARQIVTGQSTQYDKALALQDYFRNEFTYDVNVPRGHGLSAIEQFLTVKRGYCEQFAGTYAAFARALGIPARVAVGFTTGIYDSNDARYHVEGKHAHAWPEVYFEGIGWVPFEPTPTRGAPGNQTYTGVAPQQEGQAPSTTTATTAAGAANGGTSVTTSPLAKERDGGVSIPDFAAAAAARSKGAPSWLIRLLVFVGVVALVALLWLLLFPHLVAMRWKRRRSAATTPGDMALVSWHQTEAAMARSGAPPIPSETPLEYARRAARVLNLDEPALERFAEHVTVAAYAPSGIDNIVLTDCDQIRTDVTNTLHRRADIGTRLRWRSDPRPLFQPLPGDHERRRHLELVGS
jgi:transglutaminase-like putative cysteine protease